MKNSPEKSFIDKLLISFIKVMGMYQKLPSGIKQTSGILFLLFMGLFVPTGYLLYQSKDLIPYYVLITSVGTYIISTLAITINLMSYSKKWQQEDYDDITIDLAISRFILFSFLYSMIHLGLCKLLLESI